MAADGLILGDAAPAVVATDGLDVAATVLVAAVVPALLSLLANGEGGGSGYIQC